jgi:hypothetical protein
MLHQHRVGPARLMRLRFNSRERSMVEQGISKELPTLVE